MGGAHSRNKGCSFERLVADAYRKKWPALTVRRSLQAHQPFEPDVVVEGGPGGHAWQSALWSECQHADATTPAGKLAQAERDSLACGGAWMPIVIWRKSGARTVNVTLRLTTLVKTLVPPMTLDQRCQQGDLIVTLDFFEWLDTLPS